MFRKLFILILSVPSFLQGQSLVVTGTYTGKGSDNRTITGIGFSPEVVIVKGGAFPAQIRTVSMTGDIAKSIDGGGFTGNRIQSLDANGFTIGSNSYVNQTDITYYWMAFSASAMLETGSYTGNNSDNRALHVLSFHPDIVMILGDVNADAVFATADMASNESMNFSNSDLFANRIQQLLDDGFEVGTDKSVNNNNKEYQYIAIQSSPGYAATGIYTGDGSDNRFLSGVDFDPQFLMVKGVTVSAVARFGTMTGDISAYFNGAATSGNLIQSFNSSGFEVGSSNDVNQSGRGFYYFVMGGGGAGLPVELTRFNGKALEGAVLLEWETATENNNDYFTVERSADGYSFESIGEINAAGNSSQKMRYQFADDAPLQGIVYYRLKQTDFDGAATYSETITTMSAVKISKLLVYPNPNNGSFMVQLPDWLDEKVCNFSIFNHFGELVLTGIGNISGNGALLELRDQPDGIYIIQVEADGKIFINRFEKVESL